MLVITADDYGYAPSYDIGIVEAARAGAIDGVSAMVLRDPDPAPLAETPVAVGLHLEPGAAVAEQLNAFERSFGRPPAYIDGHHHCHVSEPIASEVIAVAAQLAVPVRAVGGAHRAVLREHGIETADRLVGRLDQSEPALPAEIEALISGQAPVGVTEWFVHPGHPDSSSGSSFDAGRGEDLALLLCLGDRARWASFGVTRATPAAAIAQA